LTEFNIGSTYRIKAKDWKTPSGEVITGKVCVRIILEPANKDNCLLGDEIPSDIAISEWQKFLRVECPDGGKKHLLHPRTILSAELIK
jgi:hypothetical protein